MLTPLQAFAGLVGFGVLILLAERKRLPPTAPTYLVEIQKGAVASGEIFIVVGALGSLVSLILR